MIQLSLMKDVNLNVWELKRRSSLTHAIARHRIQAVEHRTHQVCSDARFKSLGSSAGERAYLTVTS